MLHDTSQLEAIRAFRNSCHTKPAASVHAVTIADWEALCGKASQVASEEEARRFFARYFIARPLQDHDNPEGLFTGYYVPMLKGSLAASPRYRYPVYGLPPEKSNLTRAEIDNGALKGRGLELLWVDDPVMLFFMQVQGSGFVRLPDGNTVRLSFAGKNTQPYRAIGKTLLERGALQKGRVSMQAIRDWLYAHPKEAARVMHSNPSFVFFRMDKDIRQVVGVKDIPLTPMRSLAVDVNHIPAGWPVYLETTLPDGKAFHRIMIAQDTGTAIKGAVRGDIFFGLGKEAEALAGHMKAPGSLTLLMPNTKAFHD